MSGVLSMMIATGGLPPLSVTDNFTRTSETPIVGIAGCLWTNTFTSYSAINTNTNLFTGSVAATNCGAYVTTPSWTSYPNQKATVIYNGTANSGVFVRINSSGNGYRLHFISSTSLGVNRLDAGVATPLTGSPVAVTGLISGVDTVSISIVGTGTNNITIYRNASVVTTMTDGTYANGAPGIFAFGTTSNGKTFTAVSL